MVERYGENPMQNPEIREKFRQTMIENHGVEHAMHKPEFVAKKKETMMKNHGVEYTLQNPELAKKQKETMVKNHGVEHAMQNPELAEKQRETMMERHGVKHPSQKPEFLKKQQQSAMSHKEYTFPSGKITSYQGYEHFCLDDLLEEGYDEKDIVNSIVEVPVIPYTLDGIDHKYYPDIFIPKENKIIEVKSTRTMEQELQKNLTKAKACVDLGYEFELRIYDKKGNYTILNEELYA